MANKRIKICVTSKLFAKSGGIQTVTQTLFKGVFPIFFYENEENLKKEFNPGDVAVFSGYNADTAELVEELKANGVKVVVFWHFAAAHELDESIRVDWLPLLKQLGEDKIDLFVSCKPGVAEMAEKMFGVKSFFIMNNSYDAADVRGKDGLGIYSGSSNYWVKNIPTNLYACLLTGRNTDVLPYEPSLEDIVRLCHAEDRVTGVTGGLPHEEFVQRMASRELVTYCTFSEGAPILPLEALNSGTLCLTGDNHHYWQTDEILRNLLVVNDVQDPVTIANAIERALARKDEILARYGGWKDWYDGQQVRNFQRFLDLLDTL